jgi:hypothetical protein
MKRRKLRHVYEYIDKKDPAGSNNVLIVSLDRPHVVLSDAFHFLVVIRCYTMSPSLSIQNTKS